MIRVGMGKSFSSKPVYVLEKAESVRLQCND